MDVLNGFLQALVSLVIYVFNLLMQFALYFMSLVTTSAQDILTGVHF